MTSLDGFVHFNDGTLFSLADLPHAFFDHHASQPCENVNEADRFRAG